MNEEESNNFPIKETARIVFTLTSASTNKPIDYDEKTRKNVRFYAKIVDFTDPFNKKTLP